MSENRKPKPHKPHHHTSPFPPGHPLDTFRRENEAITMLAAELREITAEILADTIDNELMESGKRWQNSLNRLQELEKHYQRKESLFFAYLDKYGISEPARDMWNLDDQIRERMKKLQQNLKSAAQDPERIRHLAKQDGTLLCDLVESMILAEENGLLPHCEARFSPADWHEIHHESARVGYCLVEPGSEYVPPQPSPPQPRVDLTDSDPGDSLIQLSTGRLTAAQLAALFRTLPCDVTFVDAENRIVFYSDWPKRHFSRTPAIIGRQLSRCHPPASEAGLKRLLDDFRSGQADSSGAVVQREERFISIRYLAVRDTAGVYQGCLEMALDITDWLNRDPACPFPRYD